MFSDTLVQEHLDKHTHVHRDARTRTHTHTYISIIRVYTFA